MIYLYKPEITSVKSQLLKELIQLSTRGRSGRKRWPWSYWVPMTNIWLWPQDWAASLTFLDCVACGQSESQACITSLTVTNSTICHEIDCMPRHVTEFINIQDSYVPWKSERQFFNRCSNFLDNSFPILWCSLTMISIINPHHVTFSLLLLGFLKPDLNYTCDTGLAGPSRTGACFNTIVVHRDDNG
jgi:hypothetical protein